MSFAHLRVHSCFSMLAGTRRVEDLVRAAAAAGMPAIALADTDGMHAVVPFQRACAEAGVEPLYGVEITERGGGRRRRGARHVSRANARGVHRALPPHDAPAPRRKFLPRRRARRRLGERRRPRRGHPRARAPRGTAARVRRAPRFDRTRGGGAPLAPSAARFAPRAANGRGGGRFLHGAAGAFHAPRSHGDTHAHDGRHAPRGSGGAGVGVFPLSRGRAPRLPRRPRLSRGGARDRGGVPVRSRSLDAKAPAFQDAPRGGGLRVAPEDRAPRPSRPSRERSARRVAGGARNARARARRDRGEGARRLFSHLLGRRAVRARARDALPRAGVGREQHRLVRARGDARESAPPQPLLRALSQPRARAPAGLRHRLRDGRPRGGAPLHLPPLRQGARRDDRHLLDAQGARGAPRDGQGARHPGGGGRALRRAAAVFHLRRSARGDLRHIARIDRHPLRPRAAPHAHAPRPRDRGVSPAHGDAPVRARHLPLADHGFHAAPARRERVRDHAVVDARGRGGGAPQDRRHRPEGARRHQRGRADGGGERRAPAPPGADRLHERSPGEAAHPRGAHRGVLLHRVAGDDPAHPAGALRGFRGADGALLHHTAGRVELRGQAAVPPPPSRPRARDAPPSLARARAPRHLRLPHLSGAGDTRRGRGRRDEPRRGGRAAAMHGVQEHRRRDDERLPRLLHARGDRARRSGGDGGRDLPADRLLRRVRLLQGALGLLRPRVVRERLLEGALPGRVHGGDPLERRRATTRRRSISRRRGEWESRSSRRA